MNKSLPLNILFYSFFSGFLACLVSIFIKFAFNTDIVISESSSSFPLKLLIQLVFVGISIGLNGLMWVYYTKSLHFSANTLFSTALNKFSNFVCSAIFGFLIFNEKLNVTRWLFGLLVLLIGILILNDQESKKIKNDGDRKFKEKISSNKNQ
jgi:drug/metabolite transporter (DMT)-like permease